MRLQVRARLDGWTRGHTRCAVAGAMGLVCVMLAAVGVAGVKEIESRRAFVWRSPALDDAFVSPDERGQTVAVIGDSWVYGGKLDAPLARALTTAGYGHLDVASFGHPGANSRQILRDLEVPAGHAYASGAILTRDDIRYCIVIAGVNDSASHIGSDFYAHHMSQIVWSLLDRGIQPLVLEVPEYGLEELGGPLQRIQRAAFGQLFDEGDPDVIHRYRLALRDKLASEGLLGVVLLIPFEPVASDYDQSRALYKNPAHLNEIGNERLAEILSSALDHYLSRQGDPAERPRS